MLVVMGYPRPHNQPGVMSICH